MNKGSKVLSGVFHLTMPVRGLDKEGMERWRNIYSLRGSPQGHTISSTDPKRVCKCEVCTIIKQEAR